MKKKNPWLIFGMCLGMIALLFLFNASPLWAYGERIASSFTSITNWVLDVIVPTVALGAIIYFCFRLFTGDHSAFVGILVVIVALVLMYASSDIIGMVKGFAR